MVANLQSLGVGELVLLLCVLPGPSAMCGVARKAGNMVYRRDPIEWMAPLSDSGK